jgi:predicted lipid-binding transport protein (Tim44 family)
MNYSFEYIDIILLAMIAGFIFLRLRGILGKKTGLDNDDGIQGKSFVKTFKEFKKTEQKLNENNFDESAKKDFLMGAKIAYETIITNFAKGNLKNIKLLIDKKVFEQFNDAVKERKNNGYISETTFIGINSASIKEHHYLNNIIEVTVDFVSEIISCVKDKNNKILSGDPEKVKKVYDTWKFLKDTRSNNPNWLLIDTTS